MKLFNVNGAIRHLRHPRWVRSLALLPDGLRFVSGSSDGTARIAEHGFAFEPDPAWVEAEAKREAERRAYAYLARLTGQQYGANKPPPAAPAPAAPAPAASSALDAFFDEDEHVPPAATPDAPADAPAPDSPSEEEQMAQAISNSLNDPTSMPAPAAAVPPTPLTTGAAVGRTTGGGAAGLSAREAAAAAAMCRRPPRDARRRRCASRRWPSVSRRRRWRKS